MLIRQAAVLRPLVRVMNEAQRHAPLLRDLHERRIFVGGLLARPRAQVRG